jgi:hypothetical protein
MSIKTDKNLIINELKSYYGLSSDSDFAKFLGIGATTLSSWRARNTVDYDLLYSKCVEVNANWFFDTNEPMLTAEGSKDVVTEQNELLLEVDRLKEENSTHLKTINRLLTMMDKEDEIKSKPIRKHPYAIKSETALAAES